MFTLGDGRRALSAMAAELRGASRHSAIAVWHAVNGIVNRRAPRFVLLGTLGFLVLVAAVTSAMAIVYTGEFWLWRSNQLQAGAITFGCIEGVAVLTGSFRARWRYVGVRDAFVIARTAVLGGALALALVLGMGLSRAGFRLVMTASGLYLLFGVGARMLARAFHEWVRRQMMIAAASFRRVVIVGAGDAGAALVKHIQANAGFRLEPVGVLDDDVNKRDIKVHGVPVVGTTADAEQVVEQLGADEIIIAVPSASAHEIEQIVDRCVATGVRIRVAPWLEGEHGLGAWTPLPLREVQAGDLLGRSQVSIDVGALRAELAHARVLVTGAAGSIGSELVRQLLQLGPAEVWLLDRDESAMYFLCDELGRLESPVPHRVLIRDVRDGQRLERTFRRVRPTHVFHAAAFKHVPLMEDHVVEAVENNVLGTWAVLQAALACGARKFVLISTDKAVNPTSVMGATKRCAEMLVAESTRGSATTGVIVRFGNVLSSNGSVVPLFERQIARGGPVTVTSREVTRYFMTVPEASRLVLQAAALPDAGGRVSVLDMGTPIRIWDLAERLVRLHGLRPGVDIEIIETGLRPGEKLHEELWWSSEHVSRSSHPRISFAEVVPSTDAMDLLGILRRGVEGEDEVGLRGVLEDLVGLLKKRPPPDDLPRAAPRSAERSLSARTSV